MNAFEKLVGMTLEREGYWVRFGVKVDLSKEEKRAIDRPSSPRWELDIVAYKGEANKLLVVECKSYLDSRGVSFKAVYGKDIQASQRYKLFVESKLRQVVLNRLVAQLRATGACAPSPKVILCLAAGRVVSGQDRRNLKEHFEKRGWLFWDDEWLRDALARVAERGYEDDVSAVVAKLLLRERKEA
jgi:hypothetical protein